MTRTNTHTNQTITIAPMVERIDLNQMLAGGSDAALLIQIEGDNFDMQIFDGDWVMIDKAKQPQENDIVIADSNGEYFLTQYNPMARRGLYLVTDKPEDKPKKTIDKYEIFGVVTFIIKTLEGGK
jgi:SOS-response transcriptional repressor LexA